MQGREVTWKLVQQLDGLLTEESYKMSMDFTGKRILVTGAGQGKLKSLRKSLKIPTKMTIFLKF